MTTHVRAISDPNLPRKLPIAALIGAGAAMAIATYFGWRRWAQRTLSRSGATEAEGPLRPADEAVRSPIHDPSAGTKRFGRGTRDRVDEASWESFPASDPPSTY